MNESELMKNRLPQILAIALCVSFPALAEDTAPAQPDAPAATTEAPADSTAVDWTARATEAFLATYREACAANGGTEPMEARKPDVYDLKYHYSLDEADAPDQSVTVYRFFCTRGAYNELHVFFMRNNSDEMQPLQFATPTIHVDYENENSEGKVLGVKIIGMEANRELINSTVDPATNSIFTDEKWRGTGDASSSGVWVLKDGRFVLSVYNVDASYDGEAKQEAILDYRKENEVLQETP